MLIISRRRLSLLALIPLLLTTGCYTVRASDGGGQGVTFTGPRRIIPIDIAIPPGYAISAIATGLSFPTGICFDDHGVPYVTEAGASEFDPPRLVRINGDATTSTIATALPWEHDRPMKPPFGPWTGVAFFKGDFYVTEGGDRESGRVLKITRDGKVTPIVENLPSVGEHRAGAPLISPDGYIYFGVGSATNSGVVGPDDSAWLAKRPQFHDFPAVDTKLVGGNFESTAREGGAREVTGAFSAYGSPTAQGQVILAQVPTAAIMRVPLTGGLPELVAAGIRNPAGLTFAPDGRLFATDQSYEARGSRPVSGAGDLLWAITPGVWYGWPDFHGDEPLTLSGRYITPGQPVPQFLLAEHPNIPPKPAAKLAVQAGASGLDFSRAYSFGDAGQAFVAEFGDTAPLAGKLTAPVGFDIVRVDTTTGVSHVFAANKGDVNSPASKLGSGGLERPIAVRFDPAGTSLYVVDFGVVLVGDKLTPQEKTGVLWKITREARR